MSRRELDVSEIDLRLYVYLLKQDDPKKCTSARLKRFKLAKPIFKKRHIPRKATLLNPFAGSVLFHGDRETVLYGGLVAVDCSWKKVEQVFSKRFEGIERRLPTLLAGNPINYGKAHRLSSAEALASALYITSFKDKAREVLRPFKWGHTFLELNMSPLEEYFSAKDRSEIIKIEREFFPFQPLQ